MLLNERVQDVQVGDTAAIRGMVGEVTAVEIAADLVTVTIFTPFTRTTLSDTFITPRNILIDRTLTPEV